jgi:hypothetical protein
LVDELAAYDPMVPKGQRTDLHAVVRVADEGRRDAFLRTIGGVENHVAIQIGEFTIRARPEGDTERTRARQQGQRGPFLPLRLSCGRDCGMEIGEGNAMVVIDHPNYGHAALIGSDTRSFLARDCF